MDNGRELEIPTGGAYYRRPLLAALLDENFAIHAIACSSGDWRGENVWGGALGLLWRGFNYISEKQVAREALLQSDSTNNISRMYITYALKCRRLIGAK